MMPRKVSERQREILLELAESNRDIALGVSPEGPKTIRVVRAAHIWASAAAKLNAVEGGAIKTPNQWRRHWIVYKSKTKTKAAESRITEGDGEPSKPHLTDIEKRLIVTLSREAGKRSAVEFPVNTAATEEGKAEEPATMCCGCLSADRMLLPLKQNMDLFSLLLNDGVCNDLKYYNTNLCWECTALLHRVKEFQQRIQRAQYYFDQLLSGNESFYKRECFSNLKIDRNIELSNYPEITTDLQTETCSKYTNQISEYNIKKEALDYEDNDDDVNNLNQDDSGKITIEIKKCMDIHELNEKRDQTSDYTNIDDTKDISNLDQDKPVGTSNEIYVEIHRIKENSYQSSDDEKQCNFDYKNDIPNSNQDNSNKLTIVKMKFEKTNVIKEENKRRINIKGGKCTWIRAQNDLNLDNVNDHITKCIYTVKDLDEMEKCKGSTWKISCFNSKANSYVKNFMELRMKDQLQSCQNPNTKYITCSECKSPVLTSQITKHWHAHTINVYKCNYCHYYGKSKFDFEFGHMLGHTYMYKCRKCRLTFGSTKDVDVHYKNMHERAQCDYCGANFVTKKLLIKHNRFVHNIPPLKTYCEECDIQLKNHAMYNRHMRTAKKHRTGPLELFPCPDCDKVYCKKQYMRNHHNLVHLGKTNFFCEQCSRYFLNGKTLRDHISTIHDKIPPVKDKLCPHCGKSFIAKVLANHIRTHTGERPFTCTYCSAGFAQRTTLVGHMRAIHKVDTKGQGLLNVDLP